MPLEAAPLALCSPVRGESDIASVQFTGNRLIAIVANQAVGEGRFCGFKITFSSTAGFRMLEEADLVRYWVSPGLQRGSHVLSVSGGGWSAEENELQGFEIKRREWLVVTGNRCLSVFSGTEPEIENGEFNDAA